MAKDKITDYDAVASNNLDVGGISVAEGMLPSGVNNAIRELMSHQKEAFGAGTPLYVDQTNNRLGIGTDSPETVLHTQTNAGDTAIFNNSVAGLGIVASRNTSTSGVPGLALRSWSTWTSSKDTGQIRFDGLTSTGAYTEYGSIYLSSSTNTSTGAASTMKFNTSDGTAPATERMRIDSSGNVGIGTASPTGRLNVVPVGNIGGSAGTMSNAALRIGTTAASSMYFDTNEIHSAETLNFFSNGTDNSVSDYIRFSTGGSAGTERMRIDSGGHLLLGQSASTIPGIGNTTAGIALRAEGVGAFSVNGNPVAYFNRNTSDGTSIQFHRQGSVVGYISVTTSSTAYNTSSDYRLKENVDYTWDATTRLKQLKPARFNFIADADRTVDGFLAHEVQGIVPEAITGTKDGMRDEEYTVSAATGDIYTPAVEATYDDDGVELTAAVDEVIHSADVERPEELAEGQQWRETTAAVMGTRSVPDYQGIDQSKLVPLLTKSLIEAVEKIEQLETRLAALEAN